MWLTLLDFKIADEALARQLSELFLQLLPARTILVPDTIEVLGYLKEKGYKLHLITNGFEKTQYSKLKHSGLKPYFREIITSESSGSIKPQKEIFYYALNKAGAMLNESIMLGDSIEVDIIGARNVGMDQVHVNYNDTEQEVVPTYTVRHLIELKEFL
jgi:putative hydrolase of the HAD superfamily